MTENTDANPCECSFYEALDEGQLTEANLESGDYDVFSTGCISTTKKTFAPGHDAKLKGYLIRWHMQGLEIRRNEGGVAISTDAATAAARYEFGHMVVAGIAKAEEKAKAAAERKAARRVSREEGKKIGKAVADAVAQVKTPTLAEVVAAEEAKHQQAEAAKVAAQQADAEWDDAVSGLAECEHDRAKKDDIECPDCGADMALMDVDPVTLADLPAEGAQNKYGIKVGRWEYDAVISSNGTAWYTDKQGKQQMARKGEYRFI